MSWQTSNAVRAASATRGAARAIAYTASTYADANGAGIYPSNKTLRAGSNAARNTVRDTLEWMVENGEAELIGRRRRGNSEYSFAPLHARHEQIEYWLPLFERGGSAIDPLQSEGGQPLTPGGQSSAQGGQSLTVGGAAADPEPLVKSLEKHQERPPTPPGGASKSISGDRGSSPSLVALPATRKQALHRQVERDADRRELAKLRKQLPTSRHPEQTKRSIETLERELGLASEDSVVAVELDGWSGWAGELLNTAEQREAVAA